MRSRNTSCSFAAFYLVSFLVIYSSIFLGCHSFRLNHNQLRDAPQVSGSTEGMSPGIFQDALQEDPRQVWTDPVEQAQPPSSCSCQEKKNQRMLRANGGDSNFLVFIEEKLGDCNDDINCLFGTLISKIVETNNPKCFDFFTGGTKELPTTLAAFKDNLLKNDIGDIKTKLNDCADEVTGRLGDAVKETGRGRADEVTGRLGDALERIRNNDAVKKLLKAIDVVKQVANGVNAALKSINECKGMIDSGGEIFQSPEIANENNVDGWFEKVTSAIESAKKGTKFLDKIKDCAKSIDDLIPEKLKKTETIKKISKKLEAMEESLRIKIGKTNGFWNKFDKQFKAVSKFVKQVGKKFLGPVGSLLGPFTECYNGFSKPSAQEDDAEAAATEEKVRNCLVGACREADDSVMTGTGAMAFGAAYAAAGAALGTVTLPVVGTVGGATVGAVVGGAVGGKIAKDLHDGSELDQYVDKLCKENVGEFLKGKDIVKQIGAIVDKFGKGNGKGDI